MKIAKKQYVHYINNNINSNLQINNTETYNLHIVYYINCLVNANYFGWLKNQIEFVYHFGGTIYVIATLNQLEEENFRINCLKLFPHLIIECNYVNEYEYPGISKVWQLGQINNKHNDIILYFHSKGASHHTSYEFNINDVYNVILKDIHLIKEIFTIFPKIDKVGYSSGGIGWIWYNFWYARGNYINQLECPLKTTRRHYYEDWLSRVVNDTDKYSDTERPITYYKNTLESCYGFFTDKQIHGNIGSYYDPFANQYKNIDNYYPTNKRLRFLRYLRQFYLRKYYQRWGYRIKNHRLDSSSSKKRIFM